MGTNVSKQSTEALTKITTNAMNKAITNISNDSSSSIDINQSIIIKAPNSFITGDISASNTSNSKLQVMVQKTNDVAASMTADIQSKLQAVMDNQVEQANEDLNLLQTNISVQDVMLSTDLTTNIAMIVENSIINTTKVAANSNQSVFIDLSGARIIGNINAAQDTVIELISNDIAKSVTQMVMDTKVINDVAIKASNKATQLNKGVDPFAIFGMIGAIVAGVVGVAVVKTLGGNRNNDQYNEAVRKAKRAQMMYMYMGIFVFVAIALLVIGLMWNAKRKKLQAYIKPDEASESFATRYLYGSKPLR